MAKKNIRRSYDLPPELVEKIDELSEEFGIPQGHLIALFSIEGVERIESGELTLDEFLEPHVNSLKYRWKINLAKRLGRLAKNNPDNE